MTEKTTRGGPRQARAVRTREHVLDGAASEFLHNGYAGTSMQAIASRIRMTKGALYAHFDSKENLAAELIDQFIESWTEICPPGQDSGMPVAQRLTYVSDALSRGLLRGERLRAALRLLADGPALSGDASARLTGIYEQLTGLIEQAQAEGIIVSHYPAEAVTRLLVSFVWGHAQAPLPIRIAEDVEGDWRILLDLLRAVRPPDPEPPSG